MSEIFEDFVIHDSLLGRIAVLPDVAVNSAKVADFDTAESDKLLRTKYVDLF
jgi:hypothetical protein